MVITAPLSSSATNVEATTRGTTRRWIGSMPSTSSASISSRMVRAPRSAQIAVDPAPATTSTVTSGPNWVTAASAAPAPEMSAAPNSVKQDVQREDEEHGQRDRHREGGQERHPEQEPALQDELAPLERRPEQRLAGEHAHAHEAADSRQRRPGLIADVVDDAGSTLSPAASDDEAASVAAQRQPLSHAPSLPQPSVCDHRLPTRG